MSRPARARIDLSALRHNLRVTKALAGSSRILAVIKANAYGHGAVPIAQALEGQVQGLAVACTEEALELRESGIRAPILLLEGLFSPQELAVAERLRLALVLHSREQVDWLLAARLQGPIECWIKVDTGMHRLGLAPAELPRLYRQVRDAPQVGGLVLMTHFAQADEPGYPATRSQMARFAEAAVGLDAPRSLANSAAILAWPEARADWVRPGIMLYGVSPLGGTHTPVGALRPVMQLESALIAVRELPGGECVGYGGGFVCPGPMRIGVVALGYADGYPRHAPDGTPVSIRGQLTRLIGRVSMDMLIVDLTGVEGVAPGDPVELWGNRISAHRVAEVSQTIAYQLFTGVSARVPRIYQA